MKLDEIIKKYLPYDKMLHFFVGFILYFIFSLFLDCETSLFLVFIVAFIKESRDYIVYGGFDFIDIFFTMIPGAAICINNL